MSNHPEVVQRAISRMVLKFKFYAALVLMITLEENDQIPTAATDGYTKIMYNRKFFESMTVDQVMFVLAHEVEHIIRLHALRRVSRNPVRWNIAADHVINTDLLAMGLKGPLDDQGRFMGMAEQRFHNVAEEKVYRLLEDEQPEPEPDDGQGQPDDGEGQPGDGGGSSGGDQDGQDQPGDSPAGSGPPTTPEGAQDIFADDLKSPVNDKGEQLSAAELDQASRVVRGKIAQAAAQVKATSGIGDIPAHLRGLLVELSEPKLDWKDVLRDFVKAKSATDYSWARLNRRVRHRGLRMPSMYSEQVGGIGIIIDTSGSCWREIPKFLSELSAIASEAKPERMVILFVDTRVQEVIETTWDNFESDMGELLTKPPHGGGTDLCAGFSWLEEQGGELDCVVCLTDMYSPWPSSFTLENETLFVDTEDYGHEPFGRRVVLMDD